MVFSPPDDPPARVAVVTVSYGSETVLAQFLASAPAAANCNLCIVVADNKPAERSEVADQSRNAGARYLPLLTNLGYGGAMNAAVETLPASIEWVLISNPDVVLGEGSIDSLVRAGDSDPLIGAVGPRILTSEGSVYPSARSIPSLRTGVGHALFANLWLANPWTREYRRDTDEAPRRREAGWLSGSCVLVRRSLFDTLGGFDPRFFMYFEDVDLGYRIGQMGYRNVYEPSAVVTHTGAHSTATESARMIRAHHDSARRFLDKKYPGPLLWPVRTALGTGLRVRSAIVASRSQH
jgi:N-acetylglucosaminyl-diphospho-decaprenol L-rhamnosyltransferase